MTEILNAEWTQANQSFLVAEFARLKDRLSGHLGHLEAAREAELEEEQAQPEFQSALDHLAELFELSLFERRVLLLCAGVEMDSQLASLCGEALGHPQRSYATFGLAMAAFPEPHWSAITPARPLRHFRLVELEPGHGLTSAPLHIDERILHFLAGVNLPDQRIAPALRAIPAPIWIAESHRALAIAVSDLLDSPDADPIVHLCGDDASGQEDIASLVTQRTGLQLFAVRAEDLPAPGLDLEQFAILWQRESLLLSAALLIQCGTAGLSLAAGHLIDRLETMVFLSSSEPLRINRAFHRFDVDKPQPLEQRELWQQVLGPAAAALNGTLDTLAQQFRLSAKVIFSTGARIATENEQVQAEELWNLCRSFARPRLENLAQRIVPDATWDDLILPPAQTQTLHQLAAQVRHRMQVYETWGFSGRGARGLGVSALFTGESGTGKTMAAEVLAHELGLDVYRIDLSSVVSKYIGETEKNLRLVFDTAEEGGVLLLFDEADALFGKRGEVKDSHDRYANIEVGYLLQRLEAYQGLAILTTNLKSSLDRSFQRRLRFTVHFPFPDAGQREAIWSRIFPSETPTEGLDARKLSQLNVPGGNIRNIALNAAFLAAQAGRPVEMVHLAEAAALEAHKIERSLSSTEIKGWV